MAFQASLIKMKKLIYTVVEIKKAMFEETNCTRSDILFVKSD